MKRTSTIVLAVLSACASRQETPARASLSDEIAACLEQQPSSEEAEVFKVQVGSAVSPAWTSTQKCLQNKVNGAGLEERRENAQQIVYVTRLKPDAPVDENARALSNGARFTVKQVWFTAPRKLSGPIPPFNPEGELGLAIVKCWIPPTGHPERCRLIKPLRGQVLIESVEQSVYSPCLNDGVAFGCDFVVAFQFKR